MQMQFEEREAELEARLSKYERPGDRNMKEGEHPHTHVSALEKELDAVKERYKRTLAEKDNEAERLREEVAGLKSKEAGVFFIYFVAFLLQNNDYYLLQVKLKMYPPCPAAIQRNGLRSSRELDADTQVKIKTLQSDLADSKRERQFLQTTIDRLQKEKQQLIIDATKRADKMGKSECCAVDQRCYFLCVRSGNRYA